MQGDRVGVAINSQPTLTFSVTKLSVKEKRKTRARTSSNSGSKDTDGAAHPQRGQHPFAQAPMEQEQQQQQQQRAFHSDDDDDDAANSDDGGMFMPFMSDTDTESDGDDKFTTNAPRSRQGEEKDQRTKKRGGGRKGKNPGVESFSLPTPLTSFILMALFFYQLFFNK